MNFHLRRLEPISDYFKSTNPAGVNSNEFKKKKELAKIYAEYLSRTEGLSPKDSLLRAKFEVRHYDEDNIINRINNDFENGVITLEEEKAEKDYYDSDLLEQDIEKLWNPQKGIKKVVPHDMFEPLYYLISNDYGTFKVGDLVIYSWRALEDSYEDFVKNRAIIKALISYQVLEKNDNKGWGEKPTYKLNIIDLRKLREVIYKGENSLDNKYFDERGAEGGVNNFLQKV